MRDYPKHIKRLIRQYAGLAYEAELKQALTSLDAEFDAWRQGQLNSFDLSSRVYDWSHGPARELYNKYNSPDLDLMVAYAIASGLLNVHEIPRDLLDHLNNAIQFYKGLETT